MKIKKLDLEIEKKIKTTSTIKFYIKRQTDAKLYKPLKSTIE